MFYFYSAMLGAGRVGVSCSDDCATMLHNKYLSSNHFLEIDFTQLKGYI
jgi:hypothetical protein